MADLKQAIEGKLIEIINPTQEIKKPHNRLWIALVAFNLIFLPLDIATGITVGWITFWFYGFFVFGAGFGTMVIHEALFSNPYAKIWQKATSIFGFLLSIGVTLVIGLAAISTSLLVEGYDRHLVGAIMAGVAFTALFVHGILIAAYYFVDPGILAKMRATSALAENERMVNEFHMAKIIVAAFNQVTAELLSSINKGDQKFMGAALSKITNRDWGLGDVDSPAPTDVVRRNSDTPGVELSPRQPPRQDQQ